MVRLTTFFVLALVAPAFAQAHLRSPWDDHQIPATDTPYQCPASPEFAKILDAEPYYTDSHHSVIDPAKKAAYEKASEGPVHLGQYVGLAADAYLLKGKQGCRSLRLHSAGRGRKS